MGLLDPWKVSVLYRMIVVCMTRVSPAGGSRDVAQINQMANSPQDGGEAQHSTKITCHVS